MDALILLLIAIFSLTTYGLVYITFRMCKGTGSVEKKYWKHKFLIMLVIVIISGVGTAYLTIGIGCFTE
ncbi:hypothetical protein [Bacillus solitudinis]|uniref:hypothetical protein n=1 Tax=Bacillus solitudinis TaxID=2014074 RepID=UPI000C232659|nr:hypothetical protein [Bacillus solitudinis]